VAHLAAAEARFYWLFIKLETDGGSVTDVSQKARGLACNEAHRCSRTSPLPPYSTSI
jgi:hypothetical protein